MSTSEGFHMVSNFNFNPISLTTFLLFLCTDNTIYYIISHTLYEVFFLLQDITIGDVYLSTFFLVNINCLLQHYQVITKYCLSEICISLAATTHSCQSKDLHFRRGHNYASRNSTFPCYASSYYMCNTMCHKS